MIEHKKVFVTGGAGFIGSHICERLSDRNDVTVYDSLARDALRYTTLAQDGKVRVVNGDVLDRDALRQAMAGAQIVIHCAAVAGIYSVVKQPTMTMKVNFLGTHNALDAAVANRVERFVDFSTSEVYGPHVYNGAEDDLTSQGAVGEKRWCYAVSKLASEHLVHTYMDEYGLPVVTIRPFNIYGPRQVGEGAVREFTRRAIRDEPITLYKDGTQIRAWCFVDDFLDGLLLAAEGDAAIGQVFNIGNPQGTTTNLELANTIRRVAGSSSAITFKEHPGPEVAIRVPSIVKAQSMLGYRPRVGLEEGIRRTVLWYREHPDA